MPRSPKGGTAFAIVLFTDMVRSTAIASELGDRRWKVLQAKHHSVIRAQLREHGGREIDTAGDGFFATFAEGEAAIRCACAIRDAVMDIGLLVRCGLNVGQVEINDGKPTGAAVVAAARIMTKAGDGEVLVSNLLRELIPGSTIEFAEAGTHDLKGLEGSWHLFRVVAVDGPPLLAALPAEELVVRRTSIVDSKAAQPLSRSKKILAGVAAFLVLAAGITFLRSRHDPGVSTIASNSIGVLDPESGEVVGTVGPFEERPGSVAAWADAVWVTNPDAATITQIDPIERAVRDSIDVGENPTALAVGFGALWVLESGGPSVSRISSGTNDIVATIDVGNGPAGIAVGEGSVWVTNRFDGTISRIDPDGGKAVKTIPVGLDPRGIVVGFGSVWVALAGSNTVVRVDPDTNSVTQPIGVGNAPGSLAVSRGPDALWVVNSLDDTVMQISPDANRVVDTIEVGKGPAEVAVVEGIVWVANEADGTLSRIEPGQTPVRTITVGSVPQGLESVDGDLWVSVRGTATSHRGGTLRMVSLLPPGGLDPRAAYNGESFRLLHLLGDGLVAFEPIGGSDATLVPDLATSKPTPTDGGRTYTFQLRDGIRYSTGEVVAATDFRRALEQGFPLNESHGYFYSGLEGGEACVSKPGRCDLSQGIVTDDASRTITFHLVAPDPEFLYKLTLPFAYPVPPSAPDENQPRKGIPGTGPYMLEAPMTRDGVALVRNPYFDVWSSAAQPEGFVDRLEWTFGVEYEAQVDAVAAGDADLAFDAYLAPDRLEDLFVRSSAQVHTSPKATTYFVVFNTEAPPFDNVDVRRALNLAFDRKRIVQIMGGEAAARPTCQQLPPNFPGYEPYCPYTKNPGPEGEGPWIAPDVEGAKRIVRRSGTAGMRVVFEYESPIGDPWGPPLGNYLVGLLDELGYHGIVKAVSGNALNSPGHEFQMEFGGWGADYPAASNFIVPFHTCGASLILPSGFCDPGIDAMIDRASGLQLEDPVASGALWADIDRAIVNQAPYLWLANQIALEFVSDRVGNYQWSLQWGSLLNQLWVR